MLGIDEIDGDRRNPSPVIDPRRQIADVADRNKNVAFADHPDGFGRMLSASAQGFSRFKTMANRALCSRSIAAGTLAVGDFPDPGDHVLLAVENDVIRAVGCRQLGLFGRSHGTDHPSTAAATLTVPSTTLGRQSQQSQDNLFGRDSSTGSAPSGLGATTLVPEGTQLHSKPLLFPLKEQRCRLKQVSESTFNPAFCCLE